MKAGFAPRWSIANWSMRDYSLQSLKPSHTLSLYLAFSFFLSKKKELWRIDRVLFRSSSVLWRQVALRDEMCSTNACTWKKRAVDVGVADPGAGCGSRTGSGLVTRSHSVFLWRKKGCCHGSIAPAIAKIATSDKMVVEGRPTSVAHSGLP